MRKRQTIKVSALTKAEFEEIKLRANFSINRALQYFADNPTETIKAEDVE